MRRHLVVLSFLAFVAAPAAVHADTVKMRSGEVLAGEAQDAGDRVIVTTDDGRISVRWRDVDVVLPDVTPAELFTERRAATADDDAAAQYALALWASRAGLAEQARECLDSVITLDPEHAGARALLKQQKVDGEWLSGEGLLEAKGFVAHEGTWLLREEAELRERLGGPVKELDDGEQRATDLIQRAAGDQERARKFAIEALEGLPPESLARPALRALRRGTPAERRVATGLLARWADVDAVRPLVYAAIMDREKSVRSAAVDALRDIDHEDTVEPLARAMWGKAPIIRMHAAEALAAYGGGQAVEYLIRRVQSTGGPGGRNHIFVGRQLSYISDFDVEIAQLSQIGDPIVGTLREGVILDTRVLGVVEEYTTVERRSFFRSLSAATGKDFGDDAAAWAEWWEDEGRDEMVASAD